MILEFESETLFVMIMLLLFQAKASANALVGGETEALQRLKRFASECKSEPAKDGSDRSGSYGANFSCKISPWLAMGCLSPRSMFDELKKSASRYVCSNICHLLSAF